MAFQLGVTLDTVQGMSSKEYTGWIKYFEQRPYGWRDDHRSAIIAQCAYQGKDKLKIDKLFPTLKSFNESNEANINKAKQFVNAIQMKTGTTLINTKD